MEGIPPDPALKASLRNWQSHDSSTTVTLTCQMSRVSFQEDSRRADQASRVIKDQSQLARSQAVGIVTGGVTRGQVAETLSMSRPPICRSLSRDKD